VLTAVGRIRVRRRYTTGAEGGSFPADEVLGLDGYLTAAARRMAARAGARDSCARAQVALRELAGWELDDETIRRLTHATAADARTTRNRRTDAARFARAEGVVETQVDAGKVNTRDGWRDVKVAVVARRPLGEPATPDQWDQRELPAPSARAVVASVEEVGTFTARVRAEADRLGVTTAADVTVLGDGAEWVWNLAADVFPQGAGALDVYHALEHIGTATRAVWGEDEAATQRREAGRRALVAEGKVGVERWICDGFEALPSGATGDALRALGAYFAAHPTRLNYRDRLAAGRSVGSGLVEGSIKQLVNRRLKHTGARWRAEHVGPLVELGAMIDTPDWGEYWTAS
jgi:hypothetical protein